MSTEKPYLRYKIEVVPTTTRETFSQIRLTTQTNKVTPLIYRTKQTATTAAPTTTIHIEIRNSKVMTSISSLGFKLYFNPEGEEKTGQTGEIYTAKAITLAKEIKLAIREYNDYLNKNQ